jgi:hypothetical protein
MRAHPIAEVDDDAVRSLLDRVDLGAEAGVVQERRGEGVAELICLRR